MTYNDALNYMMSKQSLGIKPGLDRIIKLLEFMGNPQNELKIVHIAGTNGKGTISQTTADYLIRDGYKVGVFTSPWVLDYREQIKINNKFIPENVFAQYVEKYKDFDVTEFELLTAIMYKYFYDENVDYAIVECGMGGKGDATNVELCNIAVITSISLDHTNFFGNTINEIAKEKAGIIRDQSECILYPNKECEAVFEKICNDIDTTLIKIEDRGSIIENSLAVVNTILLILDTDEVLSAKTLSTLPARQERLGDVLLDGGHNPSAALALAPHIDNEVAIIGMMADKNVDGYLSIVAPKCKMIIATTPDNSRSMPANELKMLAEKYCTKVIAIENPLDAVSFGRENGLSLVCGSFFLARDVRKELV